MSIVKAEILWFSPDSMPLPSGEVFCKNAVNEYMIGYLDIDELDNTYVCHSESEDMMDVTWWASLNQITSDFKASKA